MMATVPAQASDGYLLDTTDAWAFCDVADPKHGQVVGHVGGAQASDLVFVSAVSIGELAYGRHKNPGILGARYAAMQARLAALIVLDVNMHVAEEYGLVRAALTVKYAPKRTRGGGPAKSRVEDLINPISGKELHIQDNDLWIVCTAKTFNLRFVTHDDAEGMKRVLAEAGWVSMSDVLKV